VRRTPKQKAAHAAGLLVLSACGWFSSQLAAAADPVRGGELYSSRCGACHDLAENGAGPRHAELLGRKAGTQPGYDYSPALRSSGIVWDEQQLDRWLANPSALVPGNKMVVRLANEVSDRRDIIAFLKQATARAKATRRTGS
jgi:cytochrome c